VSQPDGAAREMNRVLAGIGFVIATSRAASGPELVTVIVKVSVASASTGLGVPLMVTAKSVLGAAWPGAILTMKMSALPLPKAGCNTPVVVGKLVDVVRPTT
jgi:hypothetical protein